MQILVLKEVKTLPQGCRFAPGGWLVTDGAAERVIGWIQSPESVKITPFLSNPGVLRRL